MTEMPELVAILHNHVEGLWGIKLNENNSLVSTFINHKSREIR